MNKWAYVTLKAYRKTLTKRKGNLPNGRRYLQMVYPVKGKYPKYAKKLVQVNIKEQRLLLKHGQRTWINIFSKKTYRWPRGTWKGSQHHKSSEKSKSKPQRDIISHLSVWLLSKRQQKIAGKDGEESKCLCTVGGNVNWCSHYRKQ